MLTVDEVKKVIYSVLEVEGCTDSGNGWDSLTHLSILIASDQNFQINLLDIEGIEKKHSISEILCFLNEKNFIKGEL